MEDTNTKEVLVQTTNGVVAPKDLEQMIKVEIQNRALIKRYIKSQLKEGVDYGKIHVVIKDKCSTYYSCKNVTHYSKDTLFKAGAEKFTSLFHLKPIFERDEMTWEVMGKQSGLFCFICKLVNNRGEVVAEGRGACSVAEKYGAINNALKIAEKRAQLDAVLRHGGLSDFFTQDLEDTEVVNVPASKKKVIAGPVQGEIVNPVKPVESKKEEKIYECVEGAEIITKAEHDYSMRLYKKALCREHQKGAVK